MLLSLFKGKSLHFLELLDKFYGSIFYCLIMGFLTAVCCVHGIEIPVYYVYVIVGGVIPCLFCKDMKGMLAPLFYGYFSCSLKTNNASAGLSLFSKPFIYHFYVYVGLILLCFISRIIFDAIHHRINRKPTLLFGYLLMMLTFGLGGLFSNTVFDGKSAIFGVVVVASLFLPYLFSFLLVDVKALKKEYFAYLLLGLGLCISLEIFNCYVPYLSDVFKFDFSFLNRDTMNIRTGWGMRNNIGGMLALSLPAPLYLATKRKYYPFYFLLEFVLLIFTFMSTSRGASVAGLVITIVGITYVMIHNWSNTSVPVGIFALLTVLFEILFTLVILFKERALLLTWLTQLFNHEFEAATSNRIEIWQTCLEDFSKYPFFGNGFYNLKTYIDPNFTYNFIPPRAHNLYMQILESCGIVGMLGYLYHRVWTGILVFRRRNMEKFFIFQVYIVFFIICMVDNHFFNIGPGLLYGILAALLEGSDLREKEERSLSVA